MDRLGMLSQSANSLSKKQPLVVGGRPWSAGGAHGFWEFERAGIADNDGLKYPGCRLSRITNAGVGIAREFWPDSPVSASTISASKFTCRLRAPLMVIDGIPSVNFVGNPRTSAFIPGRFQTASCFGDLPLSPRKGYGKVRAAVLLL